MQADVIQSMKNGVTIGGYGHVLSYNLEGRSFVLRSYERGTDDIIAEFDDLGKINSVDDVRDFIRKFLEGQKTTIDKGTKELIFSSISDMVLDFLRYERSNKVKEFVYNGAIDLDELVSQFRDSMVDGMKETYPDYEPNKNN